MGFKKYLKANLKHQKQCAMTKQKPLKIAVYSGEVPSTTFIERLIDGLAEAGHTIYLFGARTGRVGYRNGVKNVSYKQNRLYKLLYLAHYTILLWMFRPKDKRQLDALLKTRSKTLLYEKVKCYPVLWHRPDIFHIQWAKGLSDWMWVRDFGIKIVVSFLGTHINYSPITIPEIGLMYKKHFPNVDGFHAVSKAIALKGTLYGADRNKIKVVYSGMDLDTLDLHQETPKNEIFKMISVGRAHWVKGYTYAIDACKILKNSNFLFEYTIVGGLGDLELEHQIHDLGLANEVKLMGRLPFENIKHYINRADVLLLPSVEEGIANVVLEAMALKTIVLSTDCGGMNEVIENGKNGFLIPVRDPEAMAEAIFHLKTIPTEVKQDIVNRAKKTVDRQHSERQMAEGIIELYERTMQT